MVSRADHERLTFRRHGVPFGPPAVDYDELDNIRENTVLMLLGVHSGQFHDVVKAEVVESTEKDGSPIKASKYMKLPNSTTLVAPAWQLVEL